MSREAFRFMLLHFRERKPSRKCRFPEGLPPHGVQMAKSCSIDLSGRLMAVDAKPTAGKLELGPQRMLFQTHAQSPGIRPYDFSRGADRFVITSTNDVNPSPFTLVVNWDAELRKK